MKTFITGVLLLIPATLLAANPSGLNQGSTQNAPDMQNMMQVMQQVQECMAKIDENQMEQLQVQSEKFGKEIESLCAEGKRDKAQKQAMTFAKEVASSPVMKQMRECGEMAQGAVPMMEGIGVYDEKKYEETHVCD